MLGFDLGTVAAGNVAKLTSRAQRGTLAGDGRHPLTRAGAPHLVVMLDTDSLFAGPAVACARRVGWPGVKCGDRACCP